MTGKKDGKNSDDEDDEDEDDDDEDSEDGYDEDLSHLVVAPDEHCKMVLVVRT